jgi:hypothetical protein
LWVLHLVKEQDKHRFTPFFGDVNDALQVCVRVTTNAEGCALVMGVNSIQIGSCDLFDGDVLATGEVDDLPHAAAELDFFCHPQAVDLPAF